MTQDEFNIIEQNTSRISSIMATIEEIKTGNEHLFDMLEARYQATELEVQESNLKMSRATIKLDWFMALLVIITLLLMSLFIVYDNKSSKMNEQILRSVIKLDSNVHTLKDRQSAAEMKYFDMYIKNEEWIIELARKVKKIENEGKEADYFDSQYNQKSDGE